MSATDESNTAQRVIAVVAKAQHIAAESVTIDSTFEQLKIDSLDGINIVFAIEEEFQVEIPDEAARQIRSIGDVIEGVDKLLAAKAAASS